MRGHPRERVLRFDAFTLDLSRCVLLRGDAEVPLRPKPFDMLCYLAANPGRLLAKEELLEAVWPGATVSDDALVKCIGQVREALGDRRDIVETRSKRGYLFQVKVSEEPAELPLAAAPCSLSPRSAARSSHCNSAGRAA